MLPLLAVPSGSRADHAQQLKESVSPARTAEAAIVAIQENGRASGGGCTEENIDNQLLG